MGTLYNQPCVVDRTIESIWPVSPGQERMLNGEARTDDGGWCGYGGRGTMRPCDTIAFNVSGNCDTELLASTTARLVYKHGALRTHFELVPKPVQIVAPPSDRHFFVHDFSNGSQSDVMAVLRERSSFGVNPVDHLLFFVEVFSLSKFQYVLVFNIHHLISDGWSTNLIVKEFFEIINSALAGRMPRDYSTGPSFGEYSAEFARRRLNGAFAHELDFWEEQLSVRPRSMAFPSLPQDSKELAVSNKRFFLSNEVVEALVEMSLAASYPGGLLGSIVAGLGVLVGRLCGTQLVRIGCMASCRLSCDAENLVGFVANPVALSVCFTESSLFSDVVSAANETVARCLENQEVPLQDVRRRLLETGALMQDEPPYAILLSLNRLAEAPPTILNSIVSGPLPIEPRARARRVDVKMSWVFHWSSEGIKGDVRYSHDCFTDASIADFVSQFIQLLRLLSVRGDLRVQEVFEVLAQTSVFSD